MQRLILLFIVLSTSFLYGKEAEDLAKRFQAGSPASVLFVGNSYSFQVPKLLEAIAGREKKSLEVAAMTKGGWPLKRHAEDATTRETIAAKAWDAIVLQEQSQIPSLPPGQRDGMMLPALKTLVKLAGERKAQILLYQTWGRRDGDQQNAAAFPNDTYEAMQTRLNDGFATACKQHPQLVPVPVNRAWAAVQKNGGGAALYAKDGSHPSAEGNYLAAAVFYCTLYRQPITSTDPKLPRSAELNRVAFEVATGASVAANPGKGKK